jgi:hypothetical protein
MQHLRSSQSQPLHHHTSEHSKSSDNSGATRATTWVRQPIAKNPGQFSCFHTKTNTRVQTHQNLFTLTKNNFAPRNNKLGANIRFSAQRPLCRVTPTKKPKLDFPCK